MKPINYFLFACIFTGFSSNLFAQHKLDSYFEHLFNNRKFMGSVAISFHDSIIYSKSVGYSDADKKAFIDENTKFRIGSLTKTYTATMILKAVEEQKLQLGDKLSGYYPEIKNAHKITIEQLLKHRSGIFNFTEIDGERQWEESFHTQKQFLDYIKNEKSNFDPGTEYEYSNTNYALLGFILENIYQKTFAEILDEKICKPLSLKKTYYTFRTDVAKNEALSYNIQDNYVRNATVNFANHPASGGIVSTPVEVNKFLFSLFHKKIINAASLQVMLPANKGEYGMGIEKLFFGKEGYEHGGRLENYISDYWYFQEEDLGIVVLANAINIDMDEINTVLLKYAYGTLPELPDFNSIKGMPVEKFDTIKGTYSNAEQKDSLTISSDGTKLVFQMSGAGQDYLLFEYKGDNTFQYGNITLQFLSEKKQVAIKQGDIVVHYSKNI